LVRDLYNGLIQEGKLGAVVHEGFWWEFGTPERFLLGHLEIVKMGLEKIRALFPYETFDEGNAKGPGMMMAPGYVEGPGFRALIDPTAQVSSSAVFDGGVVIGPRCRVG